MANVARTRRTLGWRSATLLVLAVSCSQAMAAGKVYRCGNVFQDQPCPEVKVAAASAQPQAAPAACSGKPASAGDKGCPATTTRDTAKPVQVGYK